MLMADNWLPSFDMDEQKRLDKKTEEQIAAILKDLAARRNMIAPVTDADRMAHQQFLEGMKRMPQDGWQKLIRITDRCIGCGICEKICPSASIHMEGKKAIYTPGQCETCLACVHSCPQKAIGLTVPEKNPQARYRNEHISLEEIIRSNRQKKKIAKKINEKYD